MNLRFAKGDLTETQMEALEQAGGIDIQKDENGDVVIPNLSTTQIAQIIYQAALQWGIPYNGVIVKEV